MTIRVIGVLVASVVCTRWLGLGERSVFAAVSVGNSLSAAVMMALFQRTERRIRRAMPATAT
jgi:hypothetical protein